jgi:farnesyl-diphosphate farnesyltransferase
MPDIPSKSMEDGALEVRMSEKRIDKLLEGTSRSFFLSLKVLPKKIRRHIGLTYLLARLADTIADSTVGDNKQLLQLLREYNIRIQNANQKLPDFKELAIIQENKSEAELLYDAEIPVNYFEKSDNFTDLDKEKIRTCLDIIIGGQSLDLERFTDASGEQIVSLDNEEQLDDYTYRVAGCVGEFWTHMSLDHLFKMEEEEKKVIFEKAVNFGKSLQLINILRDLPQDLQMGRCYLPRSKLSEYNLTPEDLLDKENIETFTPLFKHYIQIASSYLDNAVEYIEMLPKNQYRLRLSCMLPVLIGQRTLILLKEGNILDPDKRIKVLRPEIKKIMKKSILLCLTRKNPKKMININ